VQQVSLAQQGDKLACIQTQQVKNKKTLQGAVSLNNAVSVKRHFEKRSISLVSLQVPFKDKIKY
jgi:hypothetical protein